MKTKLHLSQAFCLCFVLSLYACKKDSNAETNSDNQDFAVASMEAHASSETAFNDVFDNVVGVNNEVGYAGIGIFGGASPSENAGEDRPSGPTGTDSTHCFTISTVHLVQGSYFPVAVTIDFAGGCVGRDGKTRKGKMTTTYSNRILLPGATAFTTFENYSVDQIKVEGTHEITNKTAGNTPAFDVKVDGKLSNAIGDFSQWVSTRSVKAVSGLATPFVLADDVYEVTGQANGTVKKGAREYQWSAETSTPLVKQFSCRWLNGGILSFKKGNRVVGSLDYGTGICDNQASLTVNGTARIITLH